MEYGLIRQGIGNRLVSRTSSHDFLVNIARNSGLDMCIRKNPSQQEDPVSPGVLLNTTLAILGAIWVDSNHSLDVTRAVMLHLE